MEVFSFIPKIVLKYNSVLAMYPSEKKVRNRNVKQEKKKIEHIPKYKLLKTSWGVQGKLFFERSTLHGVRYTAEEGRPFIEKLVYFIFCTYNLLLRIRYYELLLKLIYFCHA